MSGTVVKDAAAPTAAVARRDEPWRPSLPGVVARGAVLALIAAAVIALPLVVDAADVNIVARVAVFAMVAISLNVLVGYTGQVSLGHSAFLGVGAFSSGYALTELGVPWLGAAAFAIVIGAGAALILGGAALRIKGLYLALVTLAYGLFAEQVLFGIPAVTGGGAGMPAPRPAFAQGDVAYVYVCYAALALVWLLDVRVTSSKAGRAIKALRDSERVAASWGIDVTGYKLLAFVLSGSIAGLAGALFASIEQIVSNLTFSFTLSLTFVFMAVLGGVGSRVGVVLGAVVIAPMPFVLDRIQELNPGFPVDGSATQLITALLLLVVLLSFRGGIAQILAPVIRWCSFKRWRRGDRDAAPAAMSGGGDSGRP